MLRFSSICNVARLGALALVAWARLAVASPQAPPVPASGSKSGSPVAITNVTVIDVATGSHRVGVSVLIHGDKITSIGSRINIPRGAARLNGKGKFLIPGLWDMHSHHQGAGVEAVDLFVAKGVVGTRDMGADAGFVLPLRERIRSGELLGPEIVLSGPMLDDAPAGFPYRRPTRSAPDARIAVREAKQLGVDFIKVHDHTPRDVFFAIAEETPKVGLTFAGHVPSAVKVEEAADAGIRSIEHLANYRVFDDCATGDSLGTYDMSGCASLFDKLAAKGVWQTPTMEYFQTLPDVFSGGPLAHAEYASGSLLKLTRDNIELSNLDAKTLDKLRLLNQLGLRAIRDLHSHGSRFMAGCDGLVPGFCLHDELEWFVKAGFSPLEALQTATINPALFLGRQDSQGSIEVGKRGDVVLLDADPTSDIRNTTRIAAVVVRGKLVNRSALNRIITNHKRPTR